MIKNIVFFLMFFCLLIAITIKLVDSSIEFVSLGGPFLSFMRSCSLELNDFKIAIPDIPMIPPFEVDSGALVLLNFFISLINDLSQLINFVILLVNNIIHLLQFIFIILKNLIVLRDELVINA